MTKIERIQRLKNLLNIEAEAIRSLEYQLSERTARHANLEKQLKEVKK